VPYRPSFALDALGQPSAGVAVGPFGTGVAGGIYALWGDQLSDQMIFSALSANGQVKDFGGALYYQNLRRRWNWLTGFEHVPYLSGGQYVDFGSLACPSLCYYQLLQRVFQTQGAFSLQYPFSSTRRVEFGASLARVSWEQQLDSVVLDNTGSVIVNRGTSTESFREPLYYSQVSAAAVGDNAFGAFTSPIAGRRYRFEVAPTVGSVRFTQARFDARRYFFLRPFTFALRGLHYARYGRDADNPNELSPMFLGDEILIRGYGYNSIDPRQECGTTPDRCPVFERLLGSRLAVVNAEFRIPLFGTSAFGLLDFPYLPLEVSPFVDAGLAWTSDQRPTLTFDRFGTRTPACKSFNVFYPCAERVPVFSTGLSFRFNVLGYMILETYVAKAFQRPARNLVWGIQIAPGW
jgi:hypothetical protein